MPTKKRENGKSEQSKLFRKKVRKLTDADRSNRKSPDDAIDEMVRQNIKLQGP